MDIHHSTQNYSRNDQRLQLILRRLAADVLPTVFLLLTMALGMALVASYAESKTLKPAFAVQQIFQQFP